MSSERPACEIEPVRPTASSNLILPGPKARSEPKSTRTVSRMSSMGHSAPQNDQDVSTAACRLARLLRCHCRGWCRLRARERREQAGEARGAQRQIALCHQPARPLHGGDGVMADAIDREQHNVGAADQARNERGVVLKAAVMVQKAAVRALHQVFELRNLMAAATDIENTELTKIEAFSLLAFGRHQPLDLAFGGGKLRN